MGQISLPVLNRTGYSMFWQSVWDSKLNYNRNWKEDFLIRSIIPFIFINRLTLSPHFTNYNTLKITKYTQKNQNFYLLDQPSKLVDFFYKFFKEKKKVPPYILKIWIIKFQKWLIVYFSLYSPLKTYLIRDKSNSFFFRLNQLGFFFTSIVKAKFNKTYFLKSSIDYNTF